MTPPTELVERPWYALEEAPPMSFDRCPRCNGLSFVQDDLWGAVAGEYAIGCLDLTCGFQYVGIVIGGAA
jgi:hypothetical protein